MWIGVRKSISGLPWCHPAVYLCIKKLRCDSATADWIGREHLWRKFFSFCTTPHWELGYISNYYFSGSPGYGELTLTFWKHFFSFYINLTMTWCLFWFNFLHEIVLISTLNCVENIVKCAIWNVFLMDIVMLVLFLGQENAASGHKKRRKMKKWGKVAMLEKGRGGSKQKGWW